MERREIVPLASQGSVPLATHVRSTLLSGAIAALTEMGLRERYLAALSPEWRELILAAPAGVWLPFAYADAHYSAGDSLDLPTSELLKLGGGVARHIEKTILGLAIRGAMNVGVTPATILGITPRFWARSFQGGAVSARLVGPKEAIFETMGIPLARYRYFRIGYRAAVTALLAPFCIKIYLREIPELGSHTALGMRVSWV